jgi:hypothetical protein
MKEPMIFLWGAACVASLWMIRRLWNEEGDWTWIALFPLLFDIISTMVIVVWVVEYIATHWE